MKARAICSSRPSPKRSSANLIKSIGVFAALSLLSLSAHAHAFPTDQHHFVATEPGHLLLDSHTHWDAEASSDFITYQKPLAWDGWWYRQSRVFDLSIGSISSRQFLIYQRLKLHQDLTENIQFRLAWIEERDFEQDRTLLPLELKFAITPKWAISIFGRPSLYKSEDDMGLSVYYAPTSALEVQFSAMLGDFDRNKRNLQTDEWSRAPVSWTLSVTHLPIARGPDFQRLEFHHEQLSVRSTSGAPTQSLAYQSVSLSGLHSPAFGVGGLGRSWGWRVLYDQAYNETHARSEIQSRKRALHQLEHSFRMGPHTVRPGLNLFYRENTLNGDKRRYREILPTIWFELPPRARDFGTGTLSLGYDATVFEEQHGTASDRNLEHRLNLKYDMAFKTSGQLAFLFTFDLDRFGSGETWEGGAGQFRLEF
ncbi:MAG: hypothetical protein AB7G93_07185 [Bdellovibrionales bacterium]